MEKRNQKEKKELIMVQNKTCLRSPAVNLKIKFSS